MTLRSADNGTRWKAVTPSAAAPGASRDVERDIERAGSEWRATVDAVADLIMLLDRDGSVRRCNQACSGFLGRAYSDIIGRDVRALLYGHDRFARDPLEVVFAPGRETQFPDRDGWYTAQMYPIGAAEAIEPGWVLIVTDITEQRAAAAEQRRLEAVAEAVNMAENVGFVFSGIRHELGNPINSIKVALSVLRTRLDEYSRERIITYLDRALSEVGRVEYLLRALKTYSMHEHPVMDAIPIGPFLHSFLSLVESDLANRNIRIVRSLDAPVPAALADGRALHQVMLNLLSNSADALDVPREGRGERIISITVYALPGRVGITVSDNGAGMTNAQYADLFKPFVTSKAQGTGLGLVIIRKLLLTMNGTIAVTSTSGMGTTIDLTLEAKASE
jgi:PAS domain S-box-containing protein